jgi:hypothetical protein
VLIYAMPQLLDEILDSVFSDDAQVTLLRVPSDVDSVVDAVTLTEPDVVIVEEQQAGPREVDNLLRLAPHAQALTIAEDARTALLYELRPHRRLIGELSPASIRSAVHHARRRSDLLFEPRPAP